MTALAVAASSKAEAGTGGAMLAREGGAAAVVSLSRRQLPGEGVPPAEALGTGCDSETDATFGLGMAFGAPGEASRNSCGTGGGCDRLGMAFAPAGGVLVSSAAAAAAAAPGGAVGLHGGGFLTGGAVEELAPAEAPL